MAESKTGKKTGVQRGRSPSFPFIPLGTAITRLKALDLKFGRHPIPLQKAGLAWGMKESSSQAFQTLAALKSFGFLKYEGDKNDRKAILTDDARTYLRAQQEEIKKGIIRKAAIKPKEIVKYWVEWKSDPPIDDIRLDELVLKANYTQDGAKAFIRVYDDTIAYAGFTSSGKLPAADEESEAENESEHEDQKDEVTVGVGDLIQWVSPDVLQFERPKRVRAISEDKKWVFVEDEETGLPMTQVEVVEKRVSPTPEGPSGAQPPTLPLEKEWREERLLDDEGQEILIRYKGEATRERYEFIRDYLNFKINRPKLKT